MTGRRFAWLPVFFLFAECTAFESDQNGGTTTADGGTGSSSSGSVISDASSDAPAVVDAGTCPKVGPFDQLFKGGSLGDWVNVAGAPGAISTDFVKMATGGKNGDGSIFFSYAADNVNPRRNVVTRALPDSARCFELAVDFRVANITNEGPVFAQVRFQNDRLIGLAVDAQLHVILGQQDPNAMDASTGGSGTLGMSAAAISANLWHTVVLRLEFLTRSFVATATVDGSITVSSTPGALLEFDYTKNVEVGVNYVSPADSGDIEIDRVAFQ
jgi:hypothetical protein